MIKGGYKIIDFKGTALSGTAVEMSGIYNQIVDDYNKPILVSGVTISGELKDDTFATAHVKVAQDESKSVELEVYNGVITVTEDDEVTFTLLESQSEIKDDLDNIKSYSGLLNNIPRVNTLDANNIKTTSILFSGSSSTNLPADYTFLITLSHETAVKQIAIPVTVDNYGIYLRTYRPTQEIWSEWAKTN